MRQEKTERKSLSISTRGFILILVPLLFQISLLFVLSIQLQNAEAEVQREIRAKAIISQANALSKLFYDAGVAMGGYSITKSPLFSERFEKIKKQIPLDLKELEKLIGDDPVQKGRLLRLQQITRDGLKILDEAKRAIDDNRVDVAQFRARHMYKQVRELADQLQRELLVMTAAESSLVALPTADLVRQRALVHLMIAAGMLINILAGFALVVLGFVNVGFSILRVRERGRQGVVVEASADVAESAQGESCQKNPCFSDKSSDPVFTPSVSSVPEQPRASTAASTASARFQMSRPAHGRPKSNLKIFPLSSTSTMNASTSINPRRLTSKPQRKRAS